MPSRLERELRLLAHVELGKDSSGKEKNQPFKMDPRESRTRGGMPTKIKNIDAERDGSGPTQDVSVVETPSNLTRPNNDPLDDDEAVIKFFSVLKASCFFAQCTHRRTFTHSLHT